MLMLMRWWKPAFRNNAPRSYMTWLPVTSSVLDLQLDDVRDADFENSLHAFGQSEKRSWVQCITIIPIRGISPRTRWYPSVPINSSFQTQIRLCIKTSYQKVLQMFERREWNLGKTHPLFFLVRYIVKLSYCIQIYQLAFSFSDFSFFLSGLEYFLNITQSKIVYSCCCLTPSRKAVQI